MLIASHYGLELREELQRETDRSGPSTRRRSSSRRSGRSGTRGPSSHSDTGSPPAAGLWEPPYLPRPDSDRLRDRPTPVRSRSSFNGMAVAIRSIETAHPAYFKRSLWPFSRSLDQGGVSPPRSLSGMILSIGVYFRYRGSDSSRKAWKWLLGLVAAVVTFVVAVSRPGRSIFESFATSTGSSSSTWLCFFQCFTSSSATLTKASNPPGTTRRTI